MTIRDWDAFRQVLPEMVPWLVVVALADLMPVPIWGSFELMMSFPVLLAAAFVFPPYIAGILSFAGTTDAREFRHQISAARALFNRSNVALSIMAAAWVLESMRVHPLDWPEALPAAMVALIVDVLVNASLLMLGARLAGLPATHVAQNVYAASRPLSFIAGYTCFGLLAVVLATVYSAADAWGLLAFAIPLVLARQMFVHWRSLALAQTKLTEKSNLLDHVSRRIVDERRDERLVVAAGIHDEVLPPLYKVHLMGQVLRQDLASGRLLDLEADLPDLLQATESASSALRDLVSDLRKSTIGPGGLVHTLELLARQMAVDSGMTIQVECENVPGAPLTHLLLYHVAREALANAVKHSRAHHSRISLQDVGDGVLLVVADDGVGFDPKLVDGNRHFGVQLMRERVELAGGVFLVESSPGTGTRVVAKVPIDRHLRAS
jgi:signal transduction histidine kinase